MANLILWRHAEAEAESVTGKDIDRALTKKGRKDAAKMAKWLSQYLPENTEILCSPARRCLETAAALQVLSNHKTQYHIKVADFLGVNNFVSGIAKEVINDDSSRTILLVGHQPNLGLLITKLTGMNESACAVKKGAVWWLRQRLTNESYGAAAKNYLFTVQHPDYL